MTKCKFYSECKNQQLLWDLHAGIARDEKNPVAIMDLYAGIATNEDYQQFFVTYMRVLKGMQNASYYGLLWGYCNDCKMPVAIFGLICEYCIFENGLMEFIIENDVGIIRLKCVDCFKNLQVM